MQETLNSGTLADLAVAAETILPALALTVANATVFSNVEALNPAFGRHLHNDIYTARDCALAAVPLFRLPAGAILHGGGEFLVTSDGKLVREQIGPYLDGDPAGIVRLIAEPRPVVVIDGDCLLVARFGIYTWGHWLGELLPKAVLAESRYPGRFRFAMPSQVLTDPRPEVPWIRMRESLLAYGIDASRILPVDAGCDYRFQALYAVGSVWSDHVMHPAAAAAMRERLMPAMRPAGPGVEKRVALLREGDGRSIVNAGEVAELLRQKGFSFHPIGRLRFWDQVQLFRSATVLFSVLGSDLTGLIYAREGIQVVSVAPSIFGDRFFYAMILDRHGRYADAGWHGNAFGHAADGEG